MSKTRNILKYYFRNLEPGIYTIYASSNDSVEKAVSTNVVVKGEDTVTADDLRLKHFGQRHHG